MSANAQSSPLLAAATCAGRAASAASAPPTRLFTQPQLQYVIFACPKSGTTWLQRLLSAHPETICGESRAFGDYLGSNAAGSPHITLQKYIQILSGYLAPAIPELSAGNEPFYRGVLFDWIDALGASVLARTGKKVYGEKCTPYRGTASSVVQALCHYHPQLRFVHLVRDGRDVIVSGAAQWLNQRRGAGTVAERAAAERDLRERLLRDEDYERFLEMWVDCVEAGLAARECFPAWLQVSYESLLADTPGAVTGLLRFLRLEASPEIVRACVEAASFQSLSGGRRPGEEDRGSFFRKAAAGDWVNWFSAAHLEAFEHRAGRLLAHVHREQATPAACCDSVPNPASDASIPACATS